MILKYTNLGIILNKLNIIIFNPNYKWDHKHVLMMKI